MCLCMHVSRLSALCMHKCAPPVHVHVWIVYVWVCLHVCMCMHHVYVSVHTLVPVCACALPEFIDRKERHSLGPTCHIVNSCSLSKNTFLQMTNAIINYSRTQLSWHPPLWKPLQKKVTELGASEAGPRDIPNTPHNCFPFLCQSEPPSARST